MQQQRVDREPRLALVADPVDDLLDPVAAVAARAVTPRTTLTRRFTSRSSRSPLAA